jgi:hypothetical protein
MAAVNVAARRACPGHVEIAGVILHLEAVLAVLAIGGIHLGSAVVGATDLTRLLVVDAMFLATAIASGALAYHVMRGTPWARTAVTVWSVVTIVMGTMLMVGLRIVLDPVAGESFITIGRLDRQMAGSGFWINVLLIWLLHSAPARQYFHPHSDPRR